MRITKKIHKNGYITFRLNVKDNLHGTINLIGYVNDLRKKYNNPTINIDKFEDSIFVKFFIFKRIHDQNKVNEFNEKLKQQTKGINKDDLKGLFG